LPANSGSPRRSLPVLKRLSWLAVWLLLGCGQIAGDAAFRDTSQFPTFSPTLTPAPTRTLPPPDTGWITIAPGMEQRELTLFSTASDIADNLFIVRLDPAHYRLDIAYHPADPQTLTAWLAELEGAALVANGGFFTPEYIATGRIIVNGEGSGQSYEGSHAGMLAITAGQPPQIRWLNQRPYDPLEAIQAGIQSFPMLVRPGGESGYTVQDEQRARRTAIGLDTTGRVLLIVSGRSHFTLAGFSEFLASSDLNLDVALNLDGGASSGLLLASGDGLPAFSPLPAVIAAYPITE